MNYEKENRSSNVFKEGNEMGAKSIEILLVEDNAGDVRLTQEAFKESKLIINLNIVMDGAEAMAYLRHEVKYRQKPRPDLILLDLNLPKKDGREVLAEVKKDENLKAIPVVILTTSRNEEDIAKAYGLHANCYVTKPLDFEQFLTIVNKIEEFWITIVKLPKK
jgi:chemotaxis family two-component system response regulator Rcp1